jgi:polyisoprenyl-phosphate glycosyltransferase
LLDRKVIDIFLTFTERNRIYRGLIDWIGFNKKALIFDALPNPDGRTPSYNYNKLTQLAVDSITSFSVRPLKIIAYIG